MVFNYIHVLIGTKNSHGHEIEDKISRFNEVSDVEPILVGESALADPFFEDYDLIVRIKGHDLKSIKKFINYRIQTIDGVEKIKIALRPKT